VSLQIEVYVYGNTHTFPSGILYLKENCRQSSTNKTPSFDENKCYYNIRLWKLYW